jgi:hypothetical protein
MDSRRTDSIVLQLLDAEQAVSQSLAVVCATTPPSRPNTGELLRVSEVLDVAGIAVKRAITIRRRRRLDEAQHTERAAMADAEAMTARRAPYRAITDSRGVTWDVFAVHPDIHDAAHRQIKAAFKQGWLCFESAGEKRRLRPIPSGWRSLTDHDLEQLIREAEIVPMPRRRSSRPADDTDPPPV